MTTESATISPIRRARKPAGPENTLTDGAQNAAEVLGRIRQVLLYLSATGYIDDAEPSENHRMGRYWINALVLDALEHAEAQLQQVQEVSHG